MAELTPFRLDSANQCLWRRTGSGEERILLTPTEFGVLDYLVEHAGRLVTHQQLLDAVWPGTAIEPQVVKNKIFHLRRVLEDEPKHPQYIETLPRRGYRFIGSLERSAMGGEDIPARGSRLVGRVSALLELRESVLNAAAGRVQIAFLTGETGIGKTCLADEFQRQVSGTNRAVRFGYGQCVEGFGSKEAFYPVLEAVGRLCRGPDGARVVDILATEAPTWLVQFPALLTRQHRETLRQEILGATRERMLREICEALATLSGRSPLLLVLEDLHWGDASTLDLISALARQRATARIMLLATCRPAEIAGAPLPLDALKRDLVARHLGREIVLPPLTDAEIAEYLAEGQTGATVPQELVSLLHRHTEGNPLFMIAVLEHMLKAGLVEHEPGGWRLRCSASEIAVQVPENLREMIAAQIERLSAPEQRVLEVAAIAGMTFNAAISAPTGDLDPVTFDECCDVLARRNHILRLAGTQDLPDGQVVQRYEFAHALYREVLYERQAPARRTMLHRRRAERLEQVFAAALDEVTPDLALHFEKGADWPRAVKHLRHAADVAASRYALEEARVNLQNALELASRLPLAERAPAETEILNALADMYLGTLDARAADVLTLLRERAAQYGLVDVEAKALVDLAYPLAWGSSERALEVIEQALRLSDAQGDPLTRARIRAQCMVRRIWTRGWSDEDAEERARAMAEIRSRGSPQAVAWHAIDTAAVDLFSSAYRKAIREMVEALATLAQGRDRSMHLTYAHSVREFVVPWCRVLVGEWGEAMREFDAGIALAEKNEDPYRAQNLRNNRALMLVHAMDFASARASCDAVLPALDQPGQAPWRRWCLTVGGAAEVGLGDYEAARDHLLTAREEMDRHTVLGDWYIRVYDHWALTNLWLSMGDQARAREEGESFLASAGATAERTWQGLAWEMNARIALAGDDPRQARNLIEGGLAAIDGVEAPVAAWQVHATAADVFEALGETGSAHSHWKSSRDIVLRLAASLETYEASRRTFLTSPAVARVLDATSSDRNLASEAPTVP